MGDLPTGTVTFVFTDIEGSTRLIHEHGARYGDLLAEHHRRLRAVWSRHGGVEVDTTGDAFFVAFSRAADACEAAFNAHAVLEDTPIRIRVGVHSGDATVGETGYVGLEVHRAARIAAAAHGGQTVLSSATYELARPEAIDLGDHRLKDLRAPERLYQLGEGDFPPLKSLYRTNLPIPTTRFVGRSDEVEQAAALLARDDVRLLTLTGVGGIGKTRLALQVAAQVADAYEDGVWWVPLAPVRDPELVLAAAQAAVGADEGILEHLAGRRALLLFDNFEHLLDAAGDLSRLLEECPKVDLLVTSRSRLDLSAEHESTVLPLASLAAEELFAQRVEAVGGFSGGADAVRTLCERLDRLPLALELAAGRTDLFTPEQLLEHLGERLDLFEGPRDSDPRQRTLRATIAWSYDLLAAAEALLFDRLGVFVGGCTLRAAQEICGATLPTLSSLVASNLLRRRLGEDGVPRFWMLETIREFATERLRDREDDAELRAAHAQWYAELLAGSAEEVRSGNATAFAGRREEQGNVRAALEWAFIADDASVLGRIFYGNWFFWLSGGAGREARSYAERYLAAEPRAAPEDRFAALLGIGEILRSTGDKERGTALKYEMLDLGAASPDSAFSGRLTRTWRAPLLADLACEQADRGDFALAEQHAAEALELRRLHGTPTGIAHALGAQSYVAYARRDFAHARALLREANELTPTEESGDKIARLLGIAECASYEGAADEAKVAFRAALAAGEPPNRTIDILLLRTAGVLAAQRGDPHAAARLFGAAAQLESKLGAVMLGEHEIQLQGEVLERARQAIGEQFDEEWTALTVESHADAVAAATRELAVQA